MSDNWDEDYENWLALQGTSYYADVFAKPKCECGTSITMGKDDHYSYHSEWCDIRKLGEKENAT